MTSHNNLLGWVHGLKINSNNPFLGRVEAATPYYPILRNPSIGQVISNWNTADTGALFITAAIVHAIYVWRKKKFTEHSVTWGLRATNRSVVISLAFGMVVGLRNSYYRLTGLVPNGMASRRNIEPVKYNYTSDLINKTFLSFFALNQKPQSS